MNIEEMQRRAGTASRFLKSLANEYRLLVLCQLTSEEKSVGQLEDLVGITQSALSQHLARLRRDGLVKTRRQGQTIFYSLASDEALQLVRLTYNLFCAPGEQHDETPD